MTHIVIVFGQWMYGHYTAYWRYNFETDERRNARQGLEQLTAIVKGWTS